MTDAKEADGGLEGSFRVIDGPDGDEIYRRIKGEYVNGLSIGYEPVRVRPPKPEEERAGIWRVLEEVKLREVSIVIWPMNEEALVDVGTMKDTPEGPATAAFRAALEGRGAGSLSQSFLEPGDPRRVAIEERAGRLRLPRLGVRVGRT
jgi:phage head maturation protease